jgi:crotonobetainyl-CoA:carnitine CoA-transferase CaiB-like acyl-CoA transferase
MTTQGGPLSGITVLDLSRVLAGPFATMILGDLGARIIKVERPDGGDDTRQWGPPFLQSGDTVDSTYFLSVNRNKESVRIDFADSADRALLVELIRRSDVVVENFRRGVLDRWGLGHERMREINPDIVVVSMTGFGPDGPDADRAGYDQILQGEAGLMSLTGEHPDRPVKVGVPIGDLTTGLYGVIGVLAKLIERPRVGHGGVVNVSLLASLVSLHSFQGARWLLAGDLPAANGNEHPTVVPYGAFAAADGVLQIAVGSDALWRRFAPLVGLSPSDSRFELNSDRQRRREELRGLIQDAFSAHPVAHWLKLLSSAGVPAGEVRSLDQVYEDPQVLSQGLVVEVEHPDHGTLRLGGSPIRFDAGTRSAHTRPPRLGEHDDEVRQWAAPSC